MTKRNKYTLVLLVFVVCVIATLSLSPKWFLSGDLHEFKTWYPNFGFILYHFFNWGIYFFLVIIIVLLLGFHWKQLKANHLPIFYLSIFVLLVGQFYYCRWYTEFYPAVMMPLFDEGRPGSHRNNTRAELEVFDLKNNKYTLSTKELLDDFVGSRPHKDKVSLLFLKTKKMDESFLKWFESKIKKVLKINGITSVSIYKVNQKYVYHETLRLQSEDRIKIQTFYFQ